MIIRKYMTEKEASAYLAELGVHYSVSSLQNQRVKGGGIPFLKFGTRVRYRKEDVDAWVESLPELKSTSDSSSRAR